MSTAPVLLEETVPNTPEGVQLWKLESDDRVIAFATAGDPNTGGPTTLVFPPLGFGNRRMIAGVHRCLRENEISLCLISVNRPGVGATTASDGTASNHLHRTAQDAKTVLDALGVSAVNILFMCAGTVFALHFAQSFPEKTKRLLGIASFVSPPDCKSTKGLYRLSQHTPLGLLSPVLGAGFGLVNNLLRFVSDQRLYASLTKKVSPSERQQLIKRFDASSFHQQFQWIQEEHPNGVTADLKTILKSYKDLGVSYEITNSLTMVHGERDDVTPAAAAQWLSKTLGADEFTVLEGGTHEGSLFYLDDAIIVAFRALAT